MADVAEEELGRGARRNLEAVIEEYPDLPAEAVVKEDLLRLGVAFSPGALERSGRSKPKSYFIFSFDRIPISAMAHGEDRRAPEEIVLAGGAAAFRRTVVSVRVNPESPYKVVVQGELGEEHAADEAPLTLVLDGLPLSHVVLPSAPPYYSTRLQSGRPITEVAPCIEWGYLIYLTVYRLCQYFGRDEECRFCDINENYRQQRAAGRPYVSVKTVDEVLEAMEVIAQTDSVSCAYTVTGGAISTELSGLSEGAFYARYAEAIETRFPRRWISKVVTQALLRPEVQRYRDAGVQIYHPNYEIWDRERFALICPGKSRNIGRDEWMRRIEDAATIFGPSCVIPNFVAGVEMAVPYGFPTVGEALASTGEGLAYFMRQGIVPRFTTWCPEPLSDLGRTQGPAPLRYHAGLLRLWRDTHAAHRLPAPPGYGPPGVGRAVFSVSAFMDVIDPATPVAPLPSS